MNDIFLKTWRRDPFTADPIPRWTPDSRKPWKPGESRGAWIWPRDKNMGGSPLHSWQRWKDVFTGKGPAMFKVSDRTQIRPTRPVWSNWREYDNLGYPYPERHDLNDTVRTDWQNKRYDFKTRKYTTDWITKPHSVWSDALWGRNGQALYHRDIRGNEHTWRFGNVGRGNIGPLGNDLAYRRDTTHWDWRRPVPAAAWMPLMHH